jgi:hypothetical protein
MVPRMSASVSRCAELKGKLDTTEADPRCRTSGLRRRVTLLRLWWSRKVRFATIPKTARDVFERFGETVVGTVIACGFNPRQEALRKIYMIQTRLPTQRLETVERSILIFSWSLLSSL